MCYGWPTAQQTTLPDKGVLQNSHSAKIHSLLSLLGDGWQLRADVVKGGDAHCHTLEGDGGDGAVALPARHHGKTHRGRIAMAIQMMWTVPH